MEETETIPDELRIQVEQRVSEDDFELPVLPKVAADVLKLCRQPDADAQQLSDVLHRDASIAGNVLRVANSPLLGSRVKIQSLQQAISRLGMAALTEIVTAVSVDAKMFETPQEWTALVPPDPRAHALLTALFAKELARHGRFNVETAFLQGLLHSMGKPVLMSVLRELEEASGTSYEISHIDSVLTLYHARVGGKLCDAWQLAGSISAAIRNQHDWPVCSDVQVGSVIVDFARFLADITIEQAPLELAETHAARVYLNLYPDDLQSLWGRRDEFAQFAEVGLMDAEQCDLLVIGSGPAGLSAALEAARAHKRVILVEKARRIGGECVHHGTIPSKTLRETASRYSHVRRFLSGVAPVELTDDVKVCSLMSRLQNVIDAHEGSLDLQLEHAGIQRVHGRARFASPKIVEVESVLGDLWTVRADRVVIAGGSRPRVPDNVPVDHEHILDSDSCLSLEYLPQSLVVLGGGVIACEWASVFASLGVAVTLIDKWPRPLGFLDEDLSQRFVKHFEGAHDNCTFVGGVDVESVAWDGIASVVVRLVDGQEFRADKALCALGRVADTAKLGLEHAGVTLTNRGHVDVDETGQTSAPHIFAAGDVIGPPALASTSMDQGRRAVRNAFGLPLGGTIDTIPCGLFTIPEIATVGLGQAQARERHGNVICGIADFRHLARGHISSCTDGSLRIVADEQGRRLLGAQICGEGATELIHIAQMALIAEFDVDVFLESIFNFPTLSEAYRVAAMDVIRQREATPAAR